MITDKDSLAAYNYIKKAKEVVEQLQKDECLVSWSDENNNSMIVAVAKIIQKEGRRNA